MSIFISHTDDIQQIIISSISTQRVIQLKLVSGWRTVEPYQLLCCQEEGKELLLYGYCRDVITTDSASSRWQYFHVKDMKQVELTNYSFEPLIEYYEQISVNERVTLMSVNTKSKSFYL